MFPQEAEPKYKNIVTGYRVDDTSKGKICSLMQKRIRKLKWLSVYIKHKKKQQTILKSNLIDSELGEIQSVTTKVDTEDPLSGLMHSFIITAVIARILWKPLDRQDRHNRAIKFSDDGGDRDDHMETRLNGFENYRGKLQLYF